MFPTTNSPYCVKKEQRRGIPNGKRNEYPNQTKINGEFRTLCILVRNSNPGFPLLLNFSITDVYIINVFAMPNVEIRRSVLRWCCRHSNILSIASLHGLHSITRKHLGISECNKPNSVIPCSGLQLHVADAWLVVLLDSGVPWRLK